MGRIRHSQGLLRAFLLLASFIILSLAMAPMPVAAVMGTDFGFESGLTGWSTYGNVSAGSGGDYQAGSNIWTVNPYETQMAVVVPSGNSGVFTTVADALGLSASSRSYLTTTFPNVTNMAYIYADIPLAAGESFTMAWNYVATDYAPYNDASFCSLVNLNDAGDVPLVNGFNAEVSILGATVTGTGNYSTGDYGSTGWQTATFQAAGAGTYRLGFTVFNLTDTQYTPYLFVDKEPGATLKNGVPFNPVPPDDDPPPPPVTVAPSVTTGTASAITAVSAFVSGHVTSDGGEPVTERGIVFSLVPNPTTASSKAAGGSGTGLFSAQLTGLAPGATYYARAYAINVKGTSYGDTISFTTVPPAPTVAAATAVTASGFTANWTAVAGATSYRLDVATDSSFLHLVSGYANLDAGSATSRTVSGLAAATPYYIRVRATNSAGTSPNSNTVTATTAKADQAISFPPLASRTYGDTDFNPGATATSGLTVTYTSSNPQVATIVANQVHIVGQGTTTITAAQTGNGSWNPAPDQAQTLTVLRKTLTLAGTLAASDKTYDGTTAVIVTANGLSLVGLVGDDQVTVNPVGTFSDKNAAPGKTVSLTAATSLSGTDSENYTLSLAGAPAGQAAILQRLLTLSAFHADDKIYDGTV
ncbi:MAG: YDG domain-containing protein, partial [Eubacteriales bacterium]|nr:YDG domain-containing protein [Eubacteriales bacterium]